MQIAPGVYSMGNWKGGRVRAFLLDDGHGLTLVDTLFETNAQLVLAEIKAIGRAITDLKHIVITGYRAGKAPAFTHGDKPATT